MDEEEEHHKNVYAHFGLAAFKAQCLEEELINMLSLRALSDRPPLSREEAIAAFEEHDQKTLGQLLNMALVQVRYAPEMQNTLKDALRRRNLLMHGFFADRIEKFMTFQGRNALIEELQEHQSVFRLADEYVKVITALLRKVTGITDAMLHREAAAVFGKEKADELFGKEF